MAKIKEEMKDCFLRKMDEKVLKTEIQKLVDKFERIKRENRYKTYNEENTKKDFILP